MSQKRIPFIMIVSSGLIAINQLPNVSIQLANEGSNARVWLTKE